MTEPGSAGRTRSVRLAEVRGRIAKACQAAGRDAGDITLIAVTKTRPASDVRLLAELGLRDVGENRDAEAAPKAAECADLNLTWHFIGQLQTNKCASVVRYASVVHSVDRLPADPRARQGRAWAERVIHCLIEVSLDGDPARGGALADGVPPWPRRSRPKQGLVLGGVMAIAPLDMAPAAAFARLPDSAAARAGHQAGRDGDFGRDERRSGGRGGGWRDTPANWYGVARRPRAPCQVMSHA